MLKRCVLSEPQLVVTAAAAADTVDEGNEDDVTTVAATDSATDLVFDLEEAGDPHLGAADLILQISTRSASDKRRD